MNSDNLDSTIDPNETTMETNETTESIESMDTTIERLLGVTYESSCVDTTFDESLVEANADATVRFALRSGEIKFKDGVTQKLVVSEVRTPKLKRNVVNARSQANQNDGAVVGPSGLQRNLIVPAANQGNSEAYRMPGSYRMPRSVGSPPMINLDQMQQQAVVTESASDLGNADAHAENSANPGADLLPITMNTGVSNEPNIGFGFTQGDAAVSPGPSELQQREYATNFDVAQAGNSANQGDTDPLWLMTNYGAPYRPNVSFGSNSAFDPFFGWTSSLDMYLHGANNLNNLFGSNMNASVGSNSKTSKENCEKTSNALLDARLKVIEARLKIGQHDPDKIIVISDEESGDEDKTDFSPRITSTLIKKENDE